MKQIYLNSVEFDFQYFDKCFLTYLLDFTVSSRKLTVTVTITLNCVAGY